MGSFSIFHFVVILLIALPIINLIHKKQGNFDIRFFGGTDAGLQKPKSWSSRDDMAVKIFTQSQKEEWNKTLTAARDVGRINHSSDEYDLFQKWSQRDFVAGGAQVREGNIEKYSSEIESVSTRFTGANYGKLIAEMCLRNAVEAKLFEIEQHNNQTLGGL